MVGPSDEFMEILGYFGPQAPFVLVLLIGVVLSLVFWKRHPHVALLALLGFVLYLANVLIGGFLSFWIPRRFAHGVGGNPRDMITYLTILGVARSLVATASMTMFMFAIFGWRRQPHIPPLPREPVDDTAGRCD